MDQLRSAGQGTVIVELNPHEKHDNSLANTGVRSRVNEKYEKKIRRQQCPFTTCKDDYLIKKGK